MGTQVCNVCNIEKNLTDFYFRKDTGDYRKNCKKCKPLMSKADIQARANPETKICKHCGIEKLATEYGKAGDGKWLQPYCKPCDKIRKYKHVEKNKDRYKEKSRQAYLKFKEANPIVPKLPKPIKKDDKEYIKQRTMAYSQRPEVKARKKESDRRYKKANYDKVLAMKKKHYEIAGREQARLWQKKMSSNIEFNTKKRLRGRIYVALKRGVKSESTMNLLGCSIELFKQFFESKFTEGMSWDAYMQGGIHIDHIIPCKEFDLTLASEQKKCFHYTNLQPLWESDNLKKGTSLNYNLSVVNG